MALPIIRIETTINLHILKTELTYLFDAPDLLHPDDSSAIIHIITVIIITIIIACRVFIISTVVLIIAHLAPFSLVVPLVDFFLRNCFHARPVA